MATSYTAHVIDSKLKSATSKRPAIAWGRGGNALALSPWPVAERPVEPPSIGAVVWERVPERRKQHIRATHALFLHVQQLRREENETVGSKSLWDVDGHATTRRDRLRPTANVASSLLSVSQAYRLRMLDHIKADSASTDKTSASADKTSKPTTDNERQWEVELFWTMAMSWHLAEILLFQANGEPLVPMLLEWIELGLPDGAELETEIRVVMAGVTPLEDMRFWMLVQRLVTRGHFHEARKMLSSVIYARDQIDTNAADGLVQMEKLLGKVPPLENLGLVADAEFIAHWQQWQSEVGILRREQAKRAPSSLGPTAKRGLDSLAAVLCGEAAALRAATKRWQELLVAVALFQQPTVQAHELQNHMQHCSAMIEPTFVGDQLQAAIIEMDLYQAIRYAASLDAWFVAHFADMLDACGLIDKSESDFGLREYTLVSFGCMLMSDTELWSVGADYLASCSVSGLDTLAHFITRVPIAVDSSDHDLRKVLTICERHGLIEEAMEVQRAVARRALDRGDYARAINYFDAASETESVAAVVDRVAEDYLKHGEMNFALVLDGLDEQVQLTDRLLFLGHYSRFHELMASDDLMAAAATLIEILTTNMAPPNFSRVLLIDAIPLLEASIEVEGAEDGTLLPVLSRDDTYEILRCLEEFCFSTAACTGVVRRQDGDVHLEPFVDILRLACARNLARTMMVADEQDGELDVTE